jgi:outer membrane protein
VRAFSRLLFFVVGLSWARPSFALQPLDDFVRGAETNHPELQEARAVRAQRQAEQQVATWKLLPTFTASGSYTRNQYEIVVTFPGRSGPEPIIATNQLDAALELSVPLVNVAAWEAKSASSAQLELADANTEVTRLDLRRRVARSYYQLVATSAVRHVAEESLILAQKTASIAGTRRDEGAAKVLWISSS